MVKVMITMMEVVTLLLLQVYLSLSVRRYSACNATKTWLPPVACGLVASFLPSRFTVSKVAPPPPCSVYPFLRGLQQTTVVYRSLLLSTSLLSIGRRRCLSLLSTSPSLFALWRRSYRWAFLIDVAVALKCFGVATSYLVVVG